MVILCYFGLYYYYCMMLCITYQVCLLIMSRDSDVFFVFFVVLTGSVEGATLPRLRPNKVEWFSSVPFSFSRKLFGQHFKR